MESFKGLKKQMIILILLSSVIAYLSLQVAIYIGYAIDGALFHNTENIPHYFKQILEIDIIKGLIVISGMIILMKLIIVVANYMRERVTTWFTLKISSNLKQMLYAHILKLEYSSYYSYSKIEMLQRVNEDAQEYSNFFKVQFNLILDMVSLTFFIITQGMSLSMSVTIYFILTIIVMVAFAFWYYQKMTQMLEKVISKKKKLLGMTINNINQFKFVRIYNRQKEEVEKYRRLNKDYTEQDIGFIKLILFYEIISEHVTYLSNPIICLLGGISIIKGSMTLGTLSALLMFATKLLNCFYTFGENLQVIDNFVVIKKKIQKLMDLKEEEETHNFYCLDGEITFHNVSISVSGKEILSNLNFVIQKGEKVAILGENGSGRSVLAKAILGFYPNEGNIYLNYHNIRNLDQSNIRQYVDYILGEADLFSGSIKENIILNRECSQEQFIKVAREAQIEQEIEQLEASYQTVVGEKGIKLSGGQKQRILIARALLRNKPIMIFDNSFSKLDGKTTNQILSNLIKNYPETTMIFITHKQEIQNYVDRTIKIEEGTNKDEVKTDISRYRLS